MKRNKIKDLLLIISGTAIAGFGFHFFLDHANLVTGGVGGIGIVISRALDVNTSSLVFILNMLCLFTGLLVLGKSFFIRTALGSILYPFFIFVFEQIDAYYGIGALTDNMILMVVMSSLMMGIGIGLVLRSGGSTGGLDVIQMILHRFLKLPFSSCVYLVDGVVVLAGLLTFGVEQGLFSIIGMLLNGVVIDKVIFNNAKKVLNIITDKKDEVRSAIYETIDRGVTEISAKGGFSHSDKALLVCVIDAKEYPKIEKKLLSVDKDAFVYITNATEVSGRGFSLEKHQTNN